MSAQNISEKDKLVYRSPAIVEIGTVSAVTGAGGEKVVDAWGPDGKTANDWNIHNSATPEILGPDVLE